MRTRNYDHVGATDTAPPLDRYLSDAIERPIRAGDTVLVPCVVMSIDEPGHHANVSLSPLASLPYDRRISPGDNQRRNAPGAYGFRLNAKQILRQNPGDLPVIGLEGHEITEEGVKLIELRTL